MSTFSATRGTGARAGLAMKQQRGFIKQLSKAAEIGSTYRLFIPTYQLFDENGNQVIGETGRPLYDFVIGFGAGRNLDYKALDASFMTYKRNWFEDENNIPRCTIGCDQFSRVSRAILEAQCNSEKEAAKKAADELALANGGQRDEIALIRKLDRIDEKYHGREAEEGTQRTYATVNQMVGRLDYFMIAEMLVVPMDSATNTPLWNKAELAYKKLSNTLLQKLFDIMDQPGNFNPERGYLEVTFKYGTAGQEKQAAGQAATYNGVAENLSLETAFPDLWQKFGAKKVKEITAGERDIEKANDLILTRTGFKPGAITGEDLKSKLLKWVAKNTIILTHLDITDDTTKKAAKDMIKLGLVDNISTIKVKLEEVVAEQGDESEDDAPTPVSNPQPVQTPVAPTPEPAPVQETVPSMEAASAAIESAGSLISQASEMINNGTAVTGRAAVSQNLPLNDSMEDDDEMGDLM